MNFSHSLKNYYHLVMLQIQDSSPVTFHISGVRDLFTRLDSIFLQCKARIHKKKDDGTFGNIPAGQD